LTPGPLLRNLVVLSLVVLSAIPAFAADGKKRGVQKPPGNPIISPPPPAAAEVTLDAGVRDAVTDLPVINADVFSTNPDRHARTDANGAFTMKLPAGAAVNLLISRAGYKTFTTTITTAALGTFVDRYRLTPNPTVQIRTIAGVVHQIASDTMEFGYIVPFSGFTKDRKAEMCRTDGSSLSADRDDIKRVQGPATLALNTKCCDRGPLSMVVLDMRNGEHTQGYFKDSCFGYGMLVIGLGQTTGQQIDVKLTEVAEIVFP